MLYSDVYKSRVTHLITILWLSSLSILLNKPIRLNNEYLYLLFSDIFLVIRKSNVD